ncbi:MAG: L,D-transpeptidase [Beijerinckiaceae bacterium]|nr:L,D-transpeptidase [Beijerinckiaceae bacterium]
MDRRRLLASLAASFAAVATGSAFANTNAAAPSRTAKPKARRNAVGGSWPRTVAAPVQRPGTIVVSINKRMLYLTRGDGTALAWPVAVGRSGMSWKGETRIVSKHVRPDWQAPSSIRGGRGPGPIIPGGAPNNPMGERALVLEKHEIAIHGTSPSMRGSIGSASSAGCIRMLNEHVVDLYERVRVGTPVISIA